MVRLLSFAAFAAAFVCTSMLIRGVAPEFGKFAWFWEEANDPSVVFVGSSHVYRQLDPEVFDEALSAANIPSSSFNFGMRGMQLPELSYVTERILEENDSVKWLVLEAFPANASSGLRNPSAQRFAEWHDTTRTADCLNIIWLDLSTKPSMKMLSRSLMLVVVHSTRFMKRFGNVGAFNRFAAPSGGNLGGEVTDEWKETHGHLGRGFTPLTGNRELEIPITDVEPGPAMPARSDLIRIVARIEQAAADKGVRIIWFVHPGLGQAMNKGWSSLHEQGVVKNLMNFSDSTFSSKWYVTEARYDIDHLNWTGAKQFTVAVAEELIRLETDAVH